MTEREELTEYVGECDLCGGPHRFDTSVPSDQWNAVIRAAGLPEYLCLTCVTEAFVKAGVSFNAELYGSPFSHDGRTMPKIAVHVEQAKMADSYGDLQSQIAALHDWKAKAVPLLESQREGWLAEIQMLTFHGLGQHAGPVRERLAALTALLPGAPTDG